MTFSPDLPELSLQFSEGAGINRYGRARQESLFQLRTDLGHIRVAATRQLRRIVDSEARQVTRQPQKLTDVLRHFAPEESREQLGTDGGLKRLNKHLRMKNFVHAHSEGPLAFQLMKTPQSRMWLRFRENGQ